MNYQKSFGVCTYLSDDLDGAPIKIGSQQAFDDIIRLQSDVADSVAQTTLNKINKLYEGGKC